MHPPTHTHARTPTHAHPRTHTHARTHREFDAGGEADGLLALVVRADSGARELGRHLLHNHRLKSTAPARAGRGQMRNDFTR